jgi:DNA mismatch endonuclease (patch repair protein)
MDNLTKEQRRKNMQQIRSKDTVPERKIMRELKRRKIYFADHVKGIIGNPDIVFRRKKVIVFIDSDFWHGHPKRFIMPTTNYEYWLNKIAQNKERDRKITKELRSKGWKVIRLWEYDIKHNFEKCTKAILKAIEK